MRNRSRDAKEPALITEVRFQIDLELMMDIHSHGANSSSVNRRASLKAERPSCLFSKSSLLKPKGFPHCISKSFYSLMNLV